jgi:hypothetical protein
LLDTPRADPKASIHLRTPHQPFQGYSSSAIVSQQARGPYQATSTSQLQSNKRVKSGVATTMNGIPQGPNPYLPCYPPSYSSQTHITTSSAKQQSASTNHTNHRTTSSNPQPQHHAHNSHSTTSHQQPVQPYYIHNLRHHLLSPPQPSDPFNKIYRDHFQLSFNSVRFSHGLDRIEIDNFLQINRPVLERDPVHDKEGRITVVFDLDETLVHCEDVRKKGDEIIKLTLPNGKNIEVFLILT